MSKKKKGDSKSPMPAASAGLLRFFEEETEGIKVRPEILVVLSIALIVIAALAHAFFKIDFSAMRRCVQYFYPLHRIKVHEYLASLLSACDLWYRLSDGCAQDDRLRV